MEFLLRKTRLGLGIRSAEEFLHKFKRLSKSNQEKYVMKVYKRCGVNSEEFLFVIQGLVAWCINRYWKGELSQDLVMQLIQVILEKVKTKFDKRKGKLLNFLHTEIRGELTKLWYRQNKEMDLFVRENGEENNTEFVENDVKLDRYLKDERSIVEILEEAIRERELQRCLMEFGGDSVYWRKWFWEVFKKSYVLETNH